MRAHEWYPIDEDFKTDGEDLKRKELKVSNISNSSSIFRLPKAANEEGVREVCRERASKRVNESDRERGRESEAAWEGGRWMVGEGGGWTEGDGGVIWVGGRERESFGVMWRSVLNCEMTLVRCKGEGGRE